MWDACAHSEAFVVVPPQTLELLHPLHPLCPPPNLDSSEGRAIGAWGGAKSEHRKGPDQASEPRRCRNASHYPYQMTLAASLTRQMRIFRSTEERGENTMRCPFAVWHGPVPNRRGG